MTTGGFQYWLKLILLATLVLFIGYMLFDIGRTSGYSKGRAFEADLRVLEANRRLDPSAYPKGSCQAQLSACTARGFRPYLSLDYEFQCLETKEIKLP